MNKPKTDKQGWEEKFNRKFDPDKGTWWRKDLYKSSPKVYILAVEYNKYIKHFIRDLLSLQREQVRREVVEEADLLLAMVQSTTEDTPHSEIIEMIGNIRNALSSDGEKKGVK